MNYYSQDLVQSRMDDYRREAERMGRIADARRASKLAAARSERPSTWSVVRRAPSMLAAAFTSFVG